ncbi:MAG: flagellar brake protein [Rubrivivax sp.]|jgi:c-di-GMP-binding flagellar brake protein YcgR|nr:flagellar brake protein [Rubrivivax sp.]
MFEQTRPAALDEGTRPQWADFRVEHLAEVLRLLADLRETSAPMVLSGPAGTAVVCSLWNIDRQQQRIAFIAEPQDPALQSLVDGDDAVAVGYLDNVKLQFDLQGLVLVHGPRQCALQALLPEVLYRFQRRSAYRVRTLERHAPTARLRHPAIPDMSLALRVLDVSSGGCALLIPADVPALEPGVTLHGVQFVLDAETRFTAALQIQHLSALHRDTQLRIGCEWRALHGVAEHSLQRYIDRTQKRRRLLSLD